MHIIFVLSISSKITLQVIESDEKHSIKQTIKINKTLTAFYRMLELP